MIDQFFDTYFENLSNDLPGFGVGSDPHFVTVVDLMSDKKLKMLSERGLSYPILVLEEFDDAEDTDEMGELREQEIIGAFSILDYVNPQKEQGYDAQRLKIRSCRQLAISVFSKMLQDSIHRSGNILAANHVDVDTKRQGRFVYQVAGTLSGYRIQFKWYVGGNLIQ